MHKDKRVLVFPLLDILFVSCLQNTVFVASNSVTHTTVRRRKSKLGWWYVQTQPSHWLWNQPPKSTSFMGFSLSWCFQHETQKSGRNNLVVCSVGCLRFLATPTHGTHTYTRRTTTNHVIINIRLFVIDSEWVCGNSFSTRTTAVTIVASSFWIFPGGGRCNDQIRIGTD